MTQNKKIWFYAEGFSEVAFLRWLLINYFSDVIVCATEIEFLAETNNPACYIHNSKDVNRIPYDINDMNHWVVRSNTTTVIIVCDVEKIHICPIERRQSIITRIDSDAKANRHSPVIDKSKIKYVFANPMIEEIYCSEIQITINILETKYRNRYSDNSFKLEDKIVQTIWQTHANPLERLKKLFQTNSLVFNKREFADNFFSQLDYAKCQNKTVRRLFSLVNEVFCIT